MHAIPGNFYDMIPGMELSDLVTIIAGILLCSLRVGSFLIASPLLGYKIIPLQVRIIASFVISFIVFSYIKLPDINDIAGIKLFTIIAVEIFIGLTSGMILTIIFGSATLAGEKIAASTGLSFAGLVDPESGAQTPVLSQIMSLFMIVTFLAMNGHLIAIKTVTESYKIFPIGFTSLSLEMIEVGINAGAIMFKFGALIMLPVVVGITLLNVIIGIVTRSAPTLNLFSFGFPITMMSAFFLLYLCTNTVGGNFNSVSEVAIDYVARLIEGL